MKRGMCALLACAFTICGYAAAQNATVPTTMVSKSGKSRCVFDDAAFCAANRNHSVVDVFNGQTLDRRNEEQRMASGSPRTDFAMKFPDGGNFDVSCSVARDGRVNYAQMVPGAPPSANDIESLEASGYCGKGTAD